METQALNCNNCGALLLPDTANFAICNHCGSQLAIHRTESANYTEKIARLEQTASELTQQMAELDYRNRIEQIERQWDREHAIHMSRQPARGGTHEEAAGAGIAVLIIGALSFAAGIGAAAAGLVVMGFVCIAAGGIIFAMHYGASVQFKRAKEMYLRRKASVPLPGSLPKSTNDSEVMHDADPFSQLQ